MLVIEGGACLQQAVMAGGGRGLISALLQVPWAQSCACVLVHHGWVQAFCATPCPGGQRGSVLDPTGLAAPTGVVMGRLFCSQLVSSCPGTTGNVATVDGY